MTARHNREILAKLDREQNRIRDENEWLRPDEKSEAFAKRCEKELRGSLPGNTLRVLLPANADPLAPLDPDRRALFAQRLAEIAAQAPQSAAEPSSGDPPPSGRETLSTAACTACRGSCCRSGGDHAYLTEETFARVRLAHPERTPAQILESYLACLPAETVRDSCIYHSVTGCGLPRELRSETCNRHLCGKLKNLLGTLPEQQPPPVLAVLFDDGKWARTALLDGTGCRILSETDPE